jgi:hypothetical protein
MSQTVSLYFTNNEGETVMAEFKYSQEPDPQWNDRCFLTIDERYTMAIVRTHDGLAIDIWPINDGKVWEWPYRMIEILDKETPVDPHNENSHVKAVSESAKAFGHAIETGRLSDDEDAPNFAGHYMFMGYEGRTGKALFKHIDTREYLD